MGIKSGKRKFTHKNKHMNKSADAALVIDTREQLLRIALNEFAQHGIEGVTLSKIRQLSGQGNRSAVHYHFKTKDRLVEEVVVGLIMH